MTAINNVPTINEIQADRIITRIVKQRLKKSFIFYKDSNISLDLTPKLSITNQGQWIIIVLITLTSIESANLTNPATLIPFK